MRLTKSEVEEAISTIYGHLAAGKDDREVMDEMGISAEDYKALKSAMFDAKADEIRTRPIEHTYVQYLLDQTRNVKDLTDMMVTFKSTRQLNAMVGAIRVRSEIHDKIIKTGQEMGIIRREAQKHELVGGIVVGELTNEKLRTLITGAIRELGGLMKKFGDKSIIDMEPGELHYGPALPPKTSSSGDGEAEPKRELTSPRPVPRLKTAPPATASEPASDSKFAKSATAKAKTGRRVVKGDGPPPAGIRVGVGIPALLKSSGLG